MTRKLPVYERPNVCGPCGGKCCKGMPGAAFPHDFGFEQGARVKARVRALLRSGRWSLDWWDGDPREGKDEFSRGYFLRPRIVDRTFVDPAYGGQCSWLGESGCLHLSDRPSGCRGLKPNPSVGCEVRHSSKQEAAIAWLPFHRDLDKLCDEIDTGERDNYGGMFGLLFDAIGIGR